MPTEFVYVALGGSGSLTSFVALLGTALVSETETWPMMPAVAPAPGELKPHPIIKISTVIHNFMAPNSAIRVPETAPNQRPLVKIGCPLQLSPDHGPLPAFSQFFSRHFLLNKSLTPARHNSNLALQNYGR